MTLVDLITTPTAIQTLRTAYRLTGVTCVAGPHIQANSWDEVDCILADRPAAVAVVDPYWSGSFDVTALEDLHQRHRNPIFAYANLRHRPAGEHVRLLLHAGVERVITLGEDDAPDRLAALFDHALGGALLNPVLEQVEELVSWREYVAIRWAIREGWRRTSVQDVADAVGVRPRTLRRWFNQRTQLDVRNVVRWGRLLRVSLAVSVSGMDARTAALRFDFSDLRAFRRAYRQLVGQDPEDLAPADLFDRAAKAFPVVTCC